MPLNNLEIFFQSQPLSIVWENNEYSSQNAELSLTCAQFFQFASIFLIEEVTESSASIFVLRMRTASAFSPPTSCWTITINRRALRQCDQENVGYCASAKNFSNSA